MYSELTNLLPNENRKAFRSEYLLRLATVAVLVLVAVIVLQGIFLLPSFLYEREMILMRTAELRRMAASPGTPQQQEAQSRLIALQAESTHLLELQKTATASTALRAVLAVPRPGITLSGFTFGPASGATSDTPTKVMQISGIASTRENLRSYDTALAALPYVTSADLPVTTYAQDSAIPFTITLTGSLIPPALTSSAPTASALLP